MFKNHSRYRRKTGPDPSLFGPVEIRKSIWVISCGRIGLRPFVDESLLRNKISISTRKAGSVAAEFIPILILFVHFGSLVVPTVLRTLFAQEFLV